MLREAAVIAFDGEGIDFGSGIVSSDEFDRQIIKSISFKADIHNVAGADRSLSEHLEQYDETIAKLRNFNAPLSVLVLRIGNYDFLHGKSAQQIYKTFSQYVVRARTQGWQIIATTVLEAYAYSDDIQKEIRAFNLALIKNEANADGIVNLGGEAALTDPKQRNNPALFSSDKIHPSKGGYELIAKSIASTISTLWTSKNARENIVIFGEVQTLAIYRHLIAVLQETKSERFSLDFIDSNDEYASQTVLELSKNSGRLIVQINPERPSIHEDLLASIKNTENRSTLKIPMLICKSLWPFDRRDMEVPGFDSYAAGTRGDEALKKLVKQKNSAKIAATEYSNTDIGASADLQAIYNSDIDQWQQMEAQSDVKFVEFMRGNFDSYKLFNSKKLPSNPAIKLVIDQIRKFLEFDEEQIKVSNNLLNDEELLQPETPVHPSIAVPLGLKWLKRNTLFNIYGRKVDYQRWAFEYAKFYELKQDHAPFIEIDSGSNLVALSANKIAHSKSIRALGGMSPHKKSTTQNMSNFSNYAASVNRRIQKIEKLFIYCVVLPTVLSTTYYSLFAADVYVSQSSFLVRSPEKMGQSSSLFGALLQNTGLSRSADDTYAVNDYMTSRDALESLNQSDAYQNAYGKGHGDFFSRYGVFPQQRSFEDLFKYFQKHVDTRYDTDTGITTLEVNAFTAADAKNINEQLLELGEHRVNQMNDRAKSDVISYAQQEVLRAETVLQKSSVALSEYRDKASIFDPEKQSALALQNVIQIQNQLIASKIQMAQLKSVSPENPQIPALNIRISTLQNEVEKATNSVTGGQGSLAFKSPAYERLELDRQFADRQLSTALSSLESARNNAQRQQLYLERISQPNQPDKALLPHRLRNVIATLFLGLIAWGTLKLLIASVKEHHD